MVNKALSQTNKELSPEVLDTATTSILKTVDTAGILIGTGVSMEEFAKNVKIDTENPAAFTLISLGRKWESQVAKNVQAHFGIGASVGADTNGGVFA